ncbi:transglutaminase-like domain-containing protein [Sphingobacterium sp. HSC-15S19]|uniref:transglutaminase-like domain-containing protein n=1 Tax=Sphingobacterium TaxID=28453 RepID=UPI003D21843C
MKKYLKETNILDYTNSSIQRIIEQRHWKCFDTVFRIKAIYNFVRDEIRFGYNHSNTLKSSQVLIDGFGNGNCKTILLMSFLRAVDIPCRIHGFVVDKSIIKGILDGVWYKLSPQKLLHSSVEVYVDDEWYMLEGIMLDSEYIKGFLKVKPEIRESLFIFGLFENGFENFILEKRISNEQAFRRSDVEDLGTYDSPDNLYNLHSQYFSVIKKFFFKNFARHRLNKIIDNVRNNQDV